MDTVLENVSFVNRVPGILILTPYVPKCLKIISKLLLTKHKNEQENGQ